MSSPIRSHQVLALALFIGIAFTTVAVAQPVCQGRDMLAELRDVDPKAHADLVSRAVQTPNTEAILWRIDKTGLPSSYLFGTAHLSDERITRLSPQVEQAIATAKSMVLEVADLSAESMAVAVTANVHLFVYTDGRQLDNTLPADQFAKAAAILAGAGMPAEIATRIKPWLVFMLVAIPACERNRQSAGFHALDMRLADDARKRGIPVLGLETIEGQLQMLAAIPEEQQVAMLKAVLHYVDRAEDQLETTVQLYLKRQMGLAIPFQHELARRAGTPSTAFTSFENDIVIKRNASMAEQASPLLDKGGAFIGVGALHLIGDKGLVALFRQAGYTVTAIE